MKVQPLGNRILVERDEEKTESDGGILLAPEATETPTRGTVRAVGNGEYDVASNTWIALDMVVGDRVLFGQYAGSNTVEVDGVELLIMLASDIFAIITEEVGDG